MQHLDREGVFSEFKLTDSSNASDALIQKMKKETKKVVNKMNFLPLCIRENIPTITDYASSNYSDKKDIRDTYKKKRGRPPRDIDTSIVFHMLKNRAPVTAIAKHLGIHRDTIYSNFPGLIEEGRKANNKAWREIYDPIFEAIMAEHKRKQELRLSKRRRRRYF